MTCFSSKMDWTLGSLISRSTASSSVMESHWSRSFCPAGVEARHRERRLRTGDVARAAAGWACPRAHGLPLQHAPGATRVDEALLAVRPSTFVSVSSLKMALSLKLTCGVRVGAGRVCQCATLVRPRRVP